jgi:hypothetical protein
MVDDDKLDQEINSLEDEIRKEMGLAQACAKDKTKCEVPPHNNRILDPPDRADWQTVDPTTPFAVPVSITANNEYKIVEVTGIWYANCSQPDGKGVNVLPNGPQVSELVYRNRRTGKILYSREYNGPWLVPPNTEVRFRVLDAPGQFGDNCVNKDNNPLQIRVYKPVYNEDESLSLPPGVRRPR